VEGVCFPVPISYSRQASENHVETPDCYRFDVVPSLGEDCPYNPLAPRRRPTR
jgi:hypothetical protein